MMKINFVEIPEFSRDLKKMRKRYKSIDDDLGTFKEALSVSPDCLRGAVQISNLGQNIKLPIYKARHFRCKTLKGKGVKSGIRVIYAYNQKKTRLH